ncbi:hypothetical protein EYR38_009264 [Pleurotus pulmonarius]|nr:hypothetical protein EYR38_009264 [Pleurotus pulmonarius]
MAFLLTAMLYGVSLLLIGHYFLSPARPNDAALVKCTVGLLGTLATVEMVFVSVGMYYKIVDPFLPREVFKIESMSVFTPQWCTVMTLTVAVFEPRSGMILSVSLLAFVTQLFFASRIWIGGKGPLSQSPTPTDIEIHPSVSESRSSWLYLGPIVMLAFTQFGTALASPIIMETKKGSNPSDLFNSTMHRKAIATATTAAADILCTVGLCRTLNSSRSGIGRTDAVIAKIVRYSIHRGAATSATAILTMIMFVTVAQSAFMIPLLISGQLYVISVVSMYVNGIRILVWCLTESLEGSSVEAGFMNYSMAVIHILQQP